MAVIAAVGLVAGGVAAALEGERELHPHETTDDLAAEGECDTAEETEADEHASQTVAAKANVTAEVTLNEDGTLVAQNLGVTGDQDTVVVTRSNPTNVLLPQREQRGAPARARPRHAAGARRGGRGDPRHRDAQPAVHRARRGWRQPAADVPIPTPSSVADSPYAFFVPGVEGARLEVVVP